MYLQYGGGDCYRKNDATVAPCILQWNVPTTCRKYLNNSCNFTFILHAAVLLAKRDEAIAAIHKPDKRDSSPGNVL